MTKTKKLVTAGLLTAIGILLPMFAAHLWLGPQGGQILLPMHIPVLLTGLLCGPIYGGINGLLIPILSSLLTGMPPAYPMLPIMAGELLTYGVVSGLLAKKFKFGVYPSMITAMLAGRIVYALIFLAEVAIKPVVPFKALTMFAAVQTGFPGIAVQLVLIPALLLALRKSAPSFFVADEKCDPAKQAKLMLKNGTADCVLIKNGEIIFKTTGKGLKPILQLLENNPELLDGAYVLDKVIGKAAALLLVKGGAKKIYGEVMSLSAIKFLKSNAVKSDFGQKIGIIKNQTGTGICPFEQAVMDIDDPKLAFVKIIETMAQLRTKTNTISQPLINN